MQDHRILLPSNWRHIPMIFYEDATWQGRVRITNFLFKSFSQNHLTVKANATTNRRVIYVSTISCGDIMTSASGHGLRRIGKRV